MRAPAALVFGVPGARRPLRSLKSFAHEDFVLWINSADHMTLLMRSGDHAEARCFEGVSVRVLATEAKE